MAYQNPHELIELQTEQSNYDLLTQRHEDEKVYTELRPNVVKNNTDSVHKPCTCRSKLRVVLMILGVIAIAGASSVITAMLLKQNIDNTLSDMTKEIQSLKQNKSEDLSTNVMDQDGHWSSWNSWNACSRSCNGGMTSRSRVCNNPAPSQFGMYCQGESIAYDVCNTTICPESTWSAWSPWGECSIKCNGGIQTRTRTCDGVGSCTGNNVDFSGCNNNVCASVYSNNNTYSVPMVYFTLRQHKQKLVSGKVTFYGVSINVGGGYNTTTGLFTCPVAGLYHFYFSFMQSSTTSASCYLMVNRSSLGQAETWSDGTGDAASTASYVHLTVGDIVSVGNCVRWEHVNHAGDEGVFTGALIHV